MEYKRWSKGFWSLICDSETTSPTSTEIRSMLVKLRNLQQNFPELFPVPPEAKKLRELHNLLVFTSGDSYEEVKESAEVIRSNVDFPFIMYHFKKYNPDSKGLRMNYKHTPDGELYKYSPEKKRVSYWELIGKKTKLTANFDDLFPSQATNKEFIHLPSSKDDFEEVTNEKGGKWIVQCSDLEALDDMWKNLIRLLVTGDLVALKSCTPSYSITETNPEYKTKAIMCYTADAECKLCVKRAAQNIFICTGYDSVMYYKSNKDSSNGKYRHEGFSRVAKYLFTTRGEMFEKDDINRWRKIDFNAEKHKVKLEKSADN